LLYLVSNTWASTLVKASTTKILNTSTPYLLFVDVTWNLKKGHQFKFKMWKGTLFWSIQVLVYKIFNFLYYSWILKISFKIVLSDNFVELAFDPIYLKFVVDIFTSFIFISTHYSFQVHGVLGVFVFMRWLLCGMIMANRGCKHSSHHLIILHFEIPIMN